MQHVQLGKLLRSVCHQARQGESHNQSTALNLVGAGTAQQGSERIVLRHHGHCSGPVRKAYMTGEIARVNGQAST